MGQVVNLNRFRKKKAKEERQKRAETNRRWHGRTNAEREREAAAKKRLEATIDGARLTLEQAAVDGADESCAVPSAPTTAEAPPLGAESETHPG